MTQLRKLQQQIRRAFRPSGCDSSIIVAQSQFRKAAVAERMRIYRNNSVLVVLLIRPKNGLTDEAISSLEETLKTQLSEIDTAGFAGEGRVGVLLPDYAAEDARRMANKIRRDCSAEVEIITFPDHPIDELTAEEGKDTPRHVPAATPAATFFAVRMPTWKRAIDIVGAAVGLVVLAPCILTGALLVKLSSKGTAMFMQERTGQGGKAFTIKKIRTMRMGADLIVDELRHMSDRDGPAFKLENDPRTLTVGKILRKLSIDELPQLWNVLVGDMSLVGPRPLPTAETAELKLWQRERLDVKPGITGPWQISGRNHISFDQWMKMDIDYVRNLSLWTDLKIILFTVPAVVLCRGAS